MPLLAVRPAIDMHLAAENRMSLHELSSLVVCARTVRDKHSRVTHDCQAKMLNDIDMKLSQLETLRLQVLVVTTLGY